VQTYEVDRQGGTYYIAMEYVEGASLRMLLRATRGVGLGPPLPVIAHLASALLGALAYAHDATDGRGRKLGIVHRDVTPGNLLVGVRGEVKLVDFGVARSAGRMQVTQTGMIKGTLAYMAPEQAHGGTVDVRSDLFGAAAVLYECFMGEPPYPDGPPKTAPPAPPVVAPGVPAGAAAALRRALLFRPEERFASAAEMRAAFLDGCGVAPASTEELAAWQQQAMRLVPRETELALEEARTETLRGG
jgi:serine/threonine-protein kinase